MIVMKFGGTSVGVPEHFAVALRLVRAAVPRDPVVVVSALSGVTNLIVEYCLHPERRAELSERLIERHAEWARATGVSLDGARGLLEAWRSETRGLGGDREPIGGPDRDRLLSFGERLSAALFATALRESGVDAAAVLAGDAGLVTDERFGAAHPLPEAGGLLRESLARRPPLPVVTGFLGRTADGRITTLGRGGSDYSAALIGAALGAEEIQIWTDTSGMLSADPRIVPEARPVPLLSFAEASELAYFGARVLHPKTLLPAMERAIPVRVLNTGRPDDPGSLVTPAAGPADTAWRVKSIACKKGVTAVTIASTRMLLAYGFLARVFEVFGRHHVVVDLVTTSEVSISVTVDDTARLEKAVAELKVIGRVEVRRGLAVVAVVGEGAPRRVGLPGHVFTLLGGVGIPVEMISQGASRVNLSFVVADEDADRAVRLLHRGLGLDLEAEDPMHVRHSFPSIVVFLLAFALAVAGAAPASGDHDEPGSGPVKAQASGPAPLFDGLGKYYRVIRTRSPLAQRYFDQGMNFLWGFNLHEAQRSFEECARIDPECAMCEWGVALSLGPHFNVPAIPSRTVAASGHVRNALRLLPGATPVERGLVEALAKRYSDPAPGSPDDQKRLDAAYAEAMRALMEKHPDDNDVATLYCEAMMDLRPWDLWTVDERPQPGTLEIVSTLERVLTLDPEHPGANHYYIHAVEPSPNPEKALAAADRLKKLDSIVGHLTHMPSHIYQKVGRYDDAYAANARALLRDRGYEAKAKGIQHESFYPMYTAHNAQFLSWTAMSQGRSADAFRYAKASVAKMPPEMLDMMPGFDIFLTTPILAYARFGRWNHILAEPPPKKYFPYVAAIQRYARGLAFVGKRQVAGAALELDSLRAIAFAIPPEATEANNSAQHLLNIAQKVLEGMIGIREGRTDAGIRLLEEAVRAEDQTRYDEPTDWLYPVRHMLGAALLEAGRAYQAELVYRADLERNPDNGWALFGLAESLRKQKKTREAAEVQKRFSRAWARSDVRITASSY